jgi:hypothetical protein
MEITEHLNTTSETQDSSVRFGSTNLKMPFFDARLYRTLSLYQNGRGMSDQSTYSATFYPHVDYGSYRSDYYGTIGDLERQLDIATTEEEKQAIRNQIKSLRQFNVEYQNEFFAQRSFVHPYALVKLAGATGNKETAESGYSYDSFNRRKFYEIDGQDKFSGNYSKTPTTTTLIAWGSEPGKKGKTPYCFQDFVFCKWWNKIENNRMITLRRYAAPVTDDIGFRDYDENSDTQTLSPSSNPWTPLATAVTYFGEDTGNNLSDILSFSAKYNWKQLGEDTKNPFEITSSQNDAGSNLISSEGSLFNALSGGLGAMSKFIGIMGDISNQKILNIEGAAGNLPPDPYKNGPYENRILGPINVITNTYRRDRGLTFTHEGLKLKFEYVARPIAGINNKAVLLDMLSNILLLTYSSGSWFGGMWKYSTDRPSIYPFKYGDEMTKLYKGQLFGKDGYVNSLTKHAFEDSKEYTSTFLPDAFNMISNIFSGAMNSVLGFLTKDQERQQKGREELNKAAQTGTAQTLQKVIAAKAMKGTTIPYIQNQRALLTGEPVGDWHLTIGNPLNPIAMIGNLIVKDVNIQFSNELGPDDFPIGFTATITLDHGLGRDRDAIESMFNRGYGRIYTVSDAFRSSADGETKVDDYTGGVNTDEGRVQYDETRNTYFGGGYRFIAKVQQSDLQNKGAVYNGGTLGLQTLKPINSKNFPYVSSNYMVNPWQMNMTL